MVLNRRIVRDLKKGGVRYGALSLMLMSAIVVVVALSVGSESIFHTVDMGDAAANSEDGAFSVHVPLTDQQLRDIEDFGVDVEQKFSVDVSAGQGATLRVFANRMQIDLVMLDEGVLASSDDEIVVEKNYARDHDLSLGDSITLDGEVYVITGIGSVPDYRSPTQNMADALVDTSVFSVAFVSDEAFNALRVESGKTEYSYSYILGADTTTAAFREFITDMDFDVTAVDDIYMQEIIAMMEEPRVDLSDGVSALKTGSEELDAGSDTLASGARELSDAVDALHAGTTELDSGVADLSDGLSTLDAKGGELITAAREIFDALLQQASRELAASGIPVELTADNYATLLDRYSSELAPLSPENAQALGELKAQLEGYEQFIDALSAYGTALASAAQGASQLSEGVGQLEQGTAATSEGARSLATGVDELSEGATTYNTAVGEFGDELLDFVDEYLTFDYSNVTSFVPAEDNLRLTGCKDDAMINMVSALIAGAVVFILLAYMLAVFVVHTIERESAVIGTLYALGYVKRELLFHFALLPILVVAFSSIVATVIGVACASFGAQSSVEYYSYPVLQIYCPPYLWFYGIVAPTAIATAVIVLAINRRLSRPALSLLRKEHKAQRTSRFTLGSLGYLNRFRIRQQLREKRSNVTLFFGISLSILLLVFGLSTMFSMNRYVASATNGIEYSYLYLLKYPPEVIPEGGTEGYTESFDVDFAVTGGTLEVTLRGIDDQNPYYDFSIEGLGESEVVLSDATAQKFGYDVGDTFVMHDSINERMYAFEVVDIVDTGNMLDAYMDIESMRTLFGQDAAYYNTLYADTTLDIDGGRVASLVEISALANAAERITAMMNTLIILIVFLALILFIIVMYLLLKAKIDNAATGISLLKVFGYTDREIRTLYLSSNVIIVVAALAFSLPVSTWIVFALYPLMVSNIAANFEGVMEPGGYAAIIVIALATYYIVSALLSRHLKGISLAEVLKERE